MPVAVCKLLTYKGQYSTCHIKVPDVDVRLSAVKVNGGYYSFFKRFDDGETAMAALHRLAQRGDELALTSQPNGSYIMWALEAEAQEFKPPRQNRRRWPTHGPAACLVLGDARHYRQCYVQVPDLAQPVVAICYEERFYSVYQPGLAVSEAFDLAAQFTRRGNEVAIASTQKGYAVCLAEPEASPHLSD